MAAKDGRLKRIQVPFSHLFSSPQCILHPEFPSCRKNYKKDDRKTAKTIN